jgi:hypothetical protein
MVAVVRRQKKPRRLGRGLIANTLGQGSRAAGSEWKSLLATNGRAKILFQAQPEFRK